MAAPQTASAAVNGCADSSSCRWTQWYNGNWPASGSSPYCSPCVHWPLDGSQFGDLYWNGWGGQNNWVEHEVDWAVNDWNKLPYNTPVFQKANSCGCGPIQVTYTTTSLGSGLCGWADSSANSSGIVTGATVYLGSNLTYSDGPNDKGDCDIRHVLLHETGHVMAEGHSSIGGDLMYHGFNQIEVIDQDAENMLAAVYGTYAGGCSSDYCGGNADVNVPQPVYLGHLTPAQIEQATIAKAQSAARSVAAEAADADGLTWSVREQLPRPTFCTSICDPPPGGP